MPDIFVEKQIAFAEMKNVLTEIRVTMDKPAQMYTTEGIIRKLEDRTANIYPESNTEKQSEESEKERSGGMDMTKSKSNKFLTGVQEGPGTEGLKRMGDIPTWLWTPKWMRDMNTPFRKHIESQAGSVNFNIHTQTSFTGEAESLAPCREHTSFISTLGRKMAISQRISSTQSIFSDFRTTKSEINNEKSTSLVIAIMGTLVLLRFHLQVLAVGTWPSNV